MYHITHSTRIEITIWTLPIVAILAWLTISVLHHNEYKFYRGPYEISDIAAEGPYGYVGKIKQVEWSSHVYPSDAEVIEDGEALTGKQGSNHYDIRQFGLGRYSFWYGNVYFSTSDNSDPRTNGRRYQIRKPIIVSDAPVFVSLAVSIHLLLCAFIYSIHKRRNTLSPFLLTTCRFSPIAIAAMLLFLSFIVYESRVFPENTKLLWKSEIMKSFYPEIGKAFVLSRIPPEERRGQNFSAGIIKENGHELGPANSMHDTIRQTGSGAFSIWRDTVYFSSSDGSDPRYNGRSYVLYTPPSREYLTKILLILASVNITLLFVLPLFTYDHLFSRGYVHNILTLSIFILQIYFMLPYSLQSDLKTWSYLNAFNYQIFKADQFPHELACYGSDQTANRIEQIRRDLGGVVRSKALKNIFDKITMGATTDTEKHQLILRALQNRSIHTSLPSNYSSGIEIRDPLLLLELSSMWCGQTARLAVDLFEAGGYKGRLVQLGTHIIAEIYYAESWHYFDADIFGNGEVVLKEDGTIPRVTELGKPELLRRLDALSAYQESLIFDCVNPGVELTYPSYYYFSDLAYRDQPEQPGYYFKDTPLSLADPLVFSYGWANQLFVKDTTIIQGSYPIRKLPKIPQIENLIVDSRVGTVQLQFSSTDTDNDMSKYHIFVSERSRGWNYPHFAGRSEFQKYKSQNAPSVNRLESIYQLPPDDLGHLVVEADTPFSIIDMKGRKRVFISIMPVDHYGESVGRSLYPVSNELQIDLN